MVISGSVEKLKSNLSHFSNLLRGICIPAFLSGPDREIIVINEAMFNYLGISISSDMEFNSLPQLESLLGTRLDPGFMLGNHDQNSRTYKFCFSNLQGDLKHCSAKACRLDESFSDYYLYFFHDETRIVQLEDRLNRKNSELSIFSQVASALGSSLSFEEILQIILIAVTAREGLGFNRAFLFLYDEENKYLKGHIGIGPSSPEEAGRIWDSLLPDEGRTLIEVLRQYTLAMGMSENQVNQMVRGLSIPVQDGAHHLDKVVYDKRGIIIRAPDCSCKGGCDICALLGVHEFAAVPMVSGDRVLGVITADNCITSKKITDSSLSQLQVFANQAAIAIERTRLYESLADNLRQLENANMNLRHAQDELLKIERVSLWSELTYDIAHELRNPASIIGGFAALILKSRQLPEHLHEQAEIIFSECRRLEKALSDVLDFSKSFSSERSQFELRQVVQEVLDIIDTKPAKNVFRIDSAAQSKPSMIWGIRDQIKFAIYTISLMLEDHLGGKCKINIGFQSADNTMRVLFEFMDCTDKAAALLSDFANPRAGRLGLRLNMAFEAIKYNGGNFGIESDRDGLPRFFLEWARVRSGCA